MAFLIGLLTFVIIVNCILLVGLVLIQLPKKEAGAGVAFGAGATDALFGAGSGNVLTKATKYAAGIFFGLALFLAIMQSRYAHRPNSDFLNELKRQQSQGPAALQPAPENPPAQATGAPINATAGSNNSGFMMLSTNGAAAPATNAAKAH